MNDCMYCTENEKLDSLMIYVTDLAVSKVYLFREQTYYGRCIVAYKGHVNEFFELNDEERTAFSKDIAIIAKAVQQVTCADKINYGMFSDKLPHLHCHIVPKKEGGHSFGGTFTMNVEPQVLLSDSEYKELAEKIKAAI